jgi:hypothetical protein
MASGKSYLDTLAGGQEPLVIQNAPNFKIPKTIEIPSVVEAIKKAPEVKDQSIASAYDKAPDKWAFKKTLTDSELNTLSTIRPESKSVGSKPIYTSP